MTKNIKSQSGRSMVEMLGILAIIGVLSVGGIAGYRYAMQKNQVNEFLHYLQIDLMAAETEYQLKGEVNKTKATMPTSFCFYNSPNCFGFSGGSLLYQDNVPNGFCRALNGMLPCDKLIEMVEEMTSAEVSYCAFSEGDADCGAGLVVEWPN